SYPSCLLNLSSLRELSLSNLYATKPLTEENTDWGFGLCFSYLRHVEKCGWNHKRVYRIYCELALNLRIKPRRRLKRHVPEPLK
ncbi:hypothetical protein V2W54_19460, partial [Acinetobacter baumannii]